MDVAKLSAPTNNAQNPLPHEQLNNMLIRQLYQTRGLYAIHDLRLAQEAGSFDEAIKNILGIWKHILDFKVVGRLFAPPWPELWRPFDSWHSKPGQLRPANGPCSHWRDIAGNSTEVPAKWGFCHRLDSSRRWLGVSRAP